MTLMHPAPMPDEWHPFYEPDRDKLIGWLNATDAHPDVVIYAAEPPLSYDPEDDAVEPERWTLTIRKAWAPAPYVGRPFVYVWRCAVDHLGRGVAGPARIHYLDLDRWFM